MQIADFSIENTHVPSDPNEENPQVRWKVTLSYKGVPQGVFDYSTGVGHIPGYKMAWGRETISERGERRERVRVACQKGQSVRSVGGGSLGMSFGHKKLPGPKVTDFLGSLATDASCWLGARDVEEFASDMGYEEQGYAGAARAKEAFEACGRAFKTLSMCGADADALYALQEECDV